MFLQMFLMAPPGSGALSQLLPFILIIPVFYFFMIRPQMKRQKEAKKFRDALKAGDKIVTIGGIHGRIKEMNETTVVIETEGARLRVEKSAISPTAQVEIGQNTNA